MKTISGHSVAAVFRSGGDFYDMLKAGGQPKHTRCAALGRDVTQAECSAHIVGIASDAELMRCRACPNGRALALSLSAPWSISALPQTRAAVKSPSLRPGAARLVRVLPKVKKCSQTASAREKRLYQSANARKKTDPEELRRRQAERSRRYQAEVKAKKIQAAQEYADSVSALAGTLGALIPVHAEAGALGLGLVRMMLIDRLGIDMPLGKLRALCKAVGLTLSGQGATTIQINEAALAFAGIGKTKPQ